MIDEHDRGVLMESMPNHGLEAGNIGAVVYVHDGGLGCEIEFVTLDGSASKVIEVTANQVRPVGAGEVPHARQLIETRQIG